jgi:steroid 5-alpha reductase family enzyme
MQPDRARAFLWVTVAYLVALAIALLAGIAFGGGRHPIAVALIADVAATLAIFAFSFAFGNTSFYDPYWSVVPPIVAVFFALVPGGIAVFDRQLLVIALVLLWSVRLTWNWARGWTGLHHEDWRYADMRKTRSATGYWLVSFSGLHFVPTLVVFLGLLPLWLSQHDGMNRLNGLDLLAALVTLAGSALEFFADNQLRRFRLSSPPPGTTLERGLWAWSRHPNYLGEMLFWLGLALFATAAAGFVWWAWLGVAAMGAMFLLASIPMKEARMLATRPDYAERQRRVSLLIPRPPRR